MKLAEYQSLEAEVCIFLSTQVERFGDLRAAEILLAHCIAAKAQLGVWQANKDSKKTLPDPSKVE